MKPGTLCPSFCAVSGLLCPNRREIDMLISAISKTCGFFPIPVNHQCPSLSPLLAVLSFLVCVLVCVCEFARTNPQVPSALPSAPPCRSLLLLLPFMKSRLLILRLFVVCPTNPLHGQNCPHAHPTLTNDSPYGKMIHDFFAGNSDNLHLSIIYLIILITSSDVESRNPEFLVLPACCCFPHHLD